MRRRLLFITVFLGAAFLETYLRSKTGPDQDTGSEFLLALVLLVGIASLPWILRRANLFRSRSWPNVRGRVESAWVSDEHLKRSRFFSGRLTYSYDVSGERYTGDIERNFWGNGTEDKARAWAARYPHGLPVQVRYSPKNPADSVFDERDLPSQ
jgi:hypothetical protein